MSYRSSAVACAVLSAVGMSVHASDITVDTKLDADATYQDTYVKGGDATVTFDLNGKSATFANANVTQSIFSNVDVVSNGGGSLKVTSDKFAIKDADLRIENVGAVTLSGSAVGMGGATLGRSEQSKSKLEITGFNELNVCAENSGVAYRDASVDAPEVQIHGNSDSVITFKSSGQNGGEAISLTRKAEPDVAGNQKLSVSGGVINLIRDTGSSGNALSMSEKSVASFSAKEINVISNKGGILVSKEASLRLTAGRKVSISNTSASAALTLSGTGTVEIQAPTIEITAPQTGNAVNVTGSDSSPTLIVGRAEGASTLKFTGDVNLDRNNSTFSLENTTIEVKNNYLHIANLKGRSSKIVIDGFYEGDDLTVDVKTNAAENFKVLASGRLNEVMGMEALAQKLQAEASIRDGNAVTLGAEAGETAPGFVLDEDGGFVPTENPSMAAVGHFSAMNLAQWRGETDQLAARLGDLRVTPKQLGGWVRVTGYESDVSSSVAVEMKTTSVQAGGDVRLNGNWVVGGAFMYTDAEAEFSNGRGKADGYSLAAYASGFFDGGAYVDIVGRAGRISSEVEADTLSTFGGVLSGDYDNTALGISVEAGYHWPISKTFYVEPQAQLSYGIVFGDDFESKTNGVRIRQDDFETLVGRIGARLGASFNEGRGQVFVHASVHHDFMGNADAAATSRWGHTENIQTDLGGTWASYGVGSQFSMENGLSLYAMLERSSGADYDEDNRYSVGLSYRF